MARKLARDRSQKGKSIKQDSAPAVPKVTAAAAAEPSPGQATASVRTAAPFKWKLAASLSVGALLALHFALAATSLLRENPTVDEVVHMPAGITYWQKGTFRLYHQNPPLVKMVAALPVLWANPIMEPLYQAMSWKNPDPDQATFSQIFALANADRYFELFQLARLPMPLFSLVGGLVVFAWSRRLYGTAGGLLSLTLWVFCPNILAHARLITSDLGATAIGVTATYAFWRYLHQPGWRWASAAGVLLGIALLSKFTMLLLFAVWPFLWLARLVLSTRRADWPTVVPRAVVHAAAIVVLSVLVVDAGYFFEGVGIPLGHFEFGSKALTRPVMPGLNRPRSKNLILTATWQFRVNRFRGTWAENIPCPLPQHFVLGFDEQKIDAEGIPQRFLAAVGSPDDEDRRRRIAAERAFPESSADDSGGYPVYLNGDLRRTGWWYYYLLALLYKVPEGTGLLVLLSLASLRFAPRSTIDWADEIALWTVPVVVLFSMSALTDINLGLRYVLSIFPYLMIATGRLVPATLALSGPRKWAMAALVAGSVGATVIASVSIFPHYLAYFNWSSGGPDQRPPRLIDSNLDWGQDLVALQKWWRETIPGERLGLAYFGQINPSIFTLRGESFDWFVPPVKPGTVHPTVPSASAFLNGPAKTLDPGWYAVSATLLYGLPWRLYDSASPRDVPAAWAPAWNIADEHADAFWYFRRFQPVKRIGHSIYVYHLSAEDVAGAAPLFMARDRLPKRK